MFFFGSVSACRMYVRACGHNALKLQTPGTRPPIENLACPTANQPKRIEAPVELTGLDDQPVYFNPTACVQIGNAVTEFSRVAHNPG
jgi:hypothetical protein